MFKKAQLNRMKKEYNELCDIIAKNPNCHEAIKERRAELAEAISKLCDNK